MGFVDMGVFWDWLSIYQKDPRLWTPACMKAGNELTPSEAEEKHKYESSRTEEEVVGFRYALHETMDLWYAHQGTTVYMLTELPEGSKRKVKYVDSGWTTYERCSAEQIKKVHLWRASWKLVLDLGVKDAANARNWPIGPDDFDVMIESKIFTNGADQQAVKALFRKMSVNQLGGIKELDFTGIAAPTTEDGQRLGGCLNLCKNLKKLDLSSVGMDDTVCQAMFSTLSRGALDKLQMLYLDSNQIGDSGLSALATVLTPGPSGKGALDNLKASWCPTPLSACLQTWHVHSPDSEHLFGVPYAGDCSL